MWVLFKLVCIRNGSMFCRFYVCFVIKFFDFGFIFFNFVVVLIEGW